MITRARVVFLDLIVKWIMQPQEVRWKNNEPIDHVADFGRKVKEINARLGSSRSVIGKVRSARKSTLEGADLATCCFFFFLFWLEALALALRFGMIAITLMRSWSSLEGADSWLKRCCKIFVIDWDGKVDKT